MEKFFVPINKKKFITWLLQKSNENGWTIVFEYSKDETYSFLSKLGSEVCLPTNSGHHYDSGCRLIAIINIAFTNKIINQIMLATHVLSIYDNEEMLFLIADDFHKQCFSSSKEFYEKNQKNICEMSLGDFY